MYMRNNKYSKYNIDGFPPNYSGQFSEESLAKEFDDPVKSTEHLHKETEHGSRNEHGPFNEKKEHKEHGETKEKRDGSLLGGLFRGDKDRDRDGKKGGLLSGLFNRGDDKDGGILSNIELEDLILLAVIFFLLKDGFEDDLIIILAIILLSS